MSSRDTVWVYGREIPKWKIRKIKEMHREGIAIRHIAAMLYLTDGQVMSVLWEGIPRGR